MKNILLVGAAGRMGHEVAQNAENAGFKVSCGIDRSPASSLGFPLYTSFEQIKEDADVLIDFSRPESLSAALSYAKARRLPCVLAATGYQEEDKRMILSAAQSIPIFQSANMSIGIYVLKKLAAEARRLLPGFDVEIIEKHHRMKADAPSGTALLLLDALKAPDSVPVYGRTPVSGRRAKDEIGVHAVRGGTLAGEHEVDFLGEQETVTLTHCAQNRTIFALGALKAAAFLIDKPAALYDMDDLMKG